MEQDITSMAIAASTKYLLEHIESTVDVNAAFERAPEAACRLLAAGAYYMGRMLAPAGTSDAQILKELESSDIEVKVNKDGKTIHVDNLNFYLTAQTVQQLNTNPKEVINQYIRDLDLEPDNLKLETKV